MAHVKDLLSVVQKYWELYIGIDDLLAPVIIELNSEYYTSSDSETDTQLKGRQQTQAFAAVEAVMRHLISRNLKKPSSGIGGFLVSKFFVKKNRILEAAAAHLCNINPDHQVLEVGFGPGLGLKEVFNKVSKGSGTVHGIDISQKSFSLANKNLKQEIGTGKIKLHLASVTDIPYDSCTFDSIFHCNCYYFWPNMDDAVTELHRVIKPDKSMVATLSLPRMKMVQKHGFMQYGNIDPERYMTSLEKNGFYDVVMKTIPFEDKEIDAIIAKARK
ncbi:uncharacterized protein LOC123563200 [Mercenaria mercenaria]|uniref:uncharacterized protein LOC123563200 n=1 Tax=Mercenaria mercenaria TaxID=6596 RepID=UPI00234EA6E8|nr:uncharacterized protein LOC123563200 [Mercenaria mercenaria]